jgi:hypothetical protein
LRRKRKLLAMRRFVHRRLLAALTLFAFCFSIATPAFSVALQGIDPVAFATICRADTGDSAASPATGDVENRLKSAHCFICLGTATPPTTPQIAPVFVGLVSLPLLLLEREQVLVRDAVAFQPLNPRAPPRD